MNHNPTNPTPATAMHWLRKARWVCASLAFSLLAACGGGGGAGDDRSGTPATANQAPTNVALVEVSSSAVGAMTVSWLPASDDTTPASSIKYQVHASTDASFTPSASTLKFEGTGVTS
ncbi:MAG: hypothetical protein U1E02_28350, partial [Hydrogenophaga sp.]|nr:hypothetical protein [Hydrogenophaga sp.]